DAAPMEGQEDWRGHADYMNALEAEGFMLLAGPPSGPPRGVGVLGAFPPTRGEGPPVPGRRGGQEFPRAARIQPLPPPVGRARPPLTLAGRTPTLAMPLRGNLCRAGGIAMQQQERELIAGLFDRLQPFESQPRDPEAEALIKERASRQPASSYLLVQTVL